MHVLQEIKQVATITSVMSMIHYWPLHLFDNKLITPYMACNKKHITNFHIHQCKTNNFVIIHTQPTITSKITELQPFHSTNVQKTYP